MQSVFCETIIHHVFCCIPRRRVCTYISEMHIYVHIFSLDRVTRLAIFHTRNDLLTHLFWQPSNSFGGSEDLALVVVVVVVRFLCPTQEIDNKQTHDDDQVDSISLFLVLAPLGKWVVVVDCEWCEETKVDDNLVGGDSTTILLLVVVVRSLHLDEQYQ